MSNQLIENDILQFVNFMSNRFTQFLSFPLMRNPQEKWDTVCKMLEPCVPALNRSGSVHQDNSSLLLPYLEKGKYSIVICNHLSDLDWSIIFTYGNPNMIPNIVTTGQTQTTQTETKLTQTSQSIQPTAFTHAHFIDVPVIGSTVADVLIGVRKGITEEELTAAIKQRMRDGFNTFILFPEGGIHCKSNLPANRAYWQKEVKKHDDFEYKELMYPRFTAYQTLVKALGADLQFIVDITLQYPSHKPWETEFNYTNYPSIVSSFSNKSGPVRCHVENINVRGRWKDVLSSKWFIDKIWKRKETLLRDWRVNKIPYPTEEKTIERTALDRTVKEKTITQDNRQQKIYPDQSKSSMKMRGRANSV